VWFLAALLHEIDRLGGFDASVIARHGRNVDGLRAFLAPYSAGDVASVTGIEAATIRELAHAWTSTPRASVHASTGLNMGRQGTLAYWLVHMLSFLTGRLDVDGGNLKSDGFYPNARSGAGDPERGYVTTEFGRLRRGGMPGTLLSHSILDSDDPMRAMIVVAGNPLLSIPGGERLREAFAKLELLVSVDIYPNATSELAHVLLPATDMYEREDLNIVNVGTSAQPFAQYAPAIVVPKALRRPEWWIAHRLLQEMGRPSLLDDVEPDPWAKLRYMLRTGSGLELDDLQRTGEPVLLPEPTPGTFYETQVRTPDQRVDCCPPTFTQAIERCRRLFADANARPAGEQLLLIHGRDPWMHNSWFANVPRMKPPGRRANPLLMHPADAAARGLTDGQQVLVTSANGEIASTIAMDEALMPGVVSMVHGWGHRASPSLGVASTYPGSNPNALLPIGDGSYEPLSSQAHMTGIPVTVSDAVSDGTSARGA
jgi:anaerobic selenocysteine-containing dehydrogenase